MPCLPENPAIREVHVRLLAWGDWAREKPDFGLGLPKATVEYRLMREGAGAARQSVRVPYETLEDILCMAVDSEVCRMPNDLMRWALFFCYVRRWNHKRAAKHLHIGYASYKDQIERARWWLAGRLEQAA